MSDVTSITEIRSARDDLRDTIKEVDRKSHGDAKFGLENEYDYPSILGGIEGLLTDISILTKAPNQFLKISTHAERTQILKSLNHLIQYISQPTNLVTYLDRLKTLLRQYSPRTRKEWFEKLGDEADFVIRKKVSLQDALREGVELLEQIKDLSREAENEKVAFTENKENADVVFETSSTELTEKIAENKVALEALETRAEEISELLTELRAKETSVGEVLEAVEANQKEIASNEKLVGKFVQTLTEREASFDKLLEKTKNYSDTLSQFESDKASYLAEAAGLIESAQKALEYKTAEGLSAAFQTEKKSISDDGTTKWLWGAGLGLLAALGLGIWVVQTSGGSIPQILGRVSLIPLPIAAAWFCASQYVKRNSLLIDYGYKMTLAKSLVGFSEQLKKNGGDDAEEYRNYVKTVLEEIHQDPLRSRNDRKQEKQVEVNPDPKDVLDIVEKAVKITATAQK